MAINPFAELSKLRYHLLPVRTDTTVSSSRKSDVPDLDVQDGIILLSLQENSSYLGAADTCPNTHSPQTRMP